MKFKVGDKIRIVNSFMRMGRNHVGSVGIVLEHRCYGGRYVGNEPTHYVVKFDCYKAPHIFMRFDLEDSCELIKSENMAEETSAPKSKIELVRKDLFITKACKCFCDDICEKGMAGMCFHKHDGQGQVKNTFKYNECNELKLLINALNS